MYIYNMILDLVGFCIVAAVLIYLPKKRPHSVYFKLFFALAVSALAVLAIDIPAWLLDGKQFPCAHEMLWLLNTIYYICQICFCYMWLLFAICKTRGEQALKRPIFLILGIPFALELALIFSNLLTGWIFTIDAANVYSRGSLYSINLILYIFYIVGGVVVSAYTALRTRDDERRQALFLLIVMVLPLFCTVLQSMFYGASCLWPCCALLLMMIHQNDQQRILAAERLNKALEAERAAKLEVELAESRMAIMLSQIQPHFLYNTLDSIAELCRIKPIDAENAMVSFSSFLRGNMDSLHATGCIPFAQELEHTKNYLSLEKIRFDERLTVEYSIQSELFRLPPLTLQPIAENAVRHGVCRKVHGGTVTITSFETNEAFVVTVCDDGVGFAPESLEAENDNVHVGIRNVRERLISRCGGSLEIQSAPGAGTLAVIKVPKRRQQAGNDLLEKAF